MDDGLQVVALISGGKDSLFSILHCHANGHRVVALANLHPSSTNGPNAPEDIDSFMYQTIGHGVLPLYATALGLPLFRQEIVGHAVNPDKDYAPAEGHDDMEQDETESLLPLLRRVKEALPEVKAVSTGAILSDYQRTRVESVALRLGLIPLSYLWQYPSLPPGSQASLLEDMAAVGQDSRIIKVASGGLDQTFLWANVADPKTINRLGRASERFGTPGDGAVLGEGGEFETLSICGPSPIWKHSIQVDDDQLVFIDGEAGSASVLLQGARIGPEISHSGPMLHPRIPSLLDEPFQNIYGLGAGEHTQQRKPYVSSRFESDSIPHTHKLVESLIGIGATAMEQTHSIMGQLTRHLDKSGHNIGDVAYTVIILRDMADFSSVNSVYGQYFTKPNPPARVTVACANVLPADASLMLSATSVRSMPGSRKGLHVQSRSYWAPANIGPYSQAIQVPVQFETGNPSTLTFVAGQIPLEPASMKLVHVAEEVAASTFRMQAVLSLQHLYRIGRCLRVSLWLCAVAFITAPDDEIARDRSLQANMVWKAAFDIASPGSEQDLGMAEDFDVWDLKNRRNIFRPAPYSHGRAPHSGALRPSDLVVVRVDELPRGAMVEWAAYGGSADDRMLGSRTVLHFDHLSALFGDMVVPG